MEKIFITENELKIAKQLKDMYDVSYREVGRLQEERFRLKNRIEQILSDLDKYALSNKEFSDAIIKKYGLGEINTDTGEFVKRENI